MQYMLTGRVISGERALVLACSLCTTALEKTEGNRNGEERHLASGPGSAIFTKHQLELIALWAGRNVQEQIQESVRSNQNDMKEKAFSRDAEQCKAK